MEVFERLSDAIRALHNLQHDGRRTRAGDFLAFGRIVVEIDNRIHSYVQLSNQLLQAGGFWLPVRLESGEIGELQRNFLVLVEGQFCDGGVILAHNTQYHSSASEVLDVVARLQKFFARRGSISEHDTFHTVVTDHPAPQRVIQIDDKALARRTAHRSQMSVEKDA